MIYYDRIDVSEEIHVNKTSKLRECDIYHYWYFLNKGLKFHSYVCNRFHDLIMMNLGDIAFINIKSSDYFCY